MARFAVLGAGAVGGFIAGALNYRSAQVTVIADDKTSSRIRTHGLQITSETLGSFNTRPTAVNLLTNPVDVLFIAVRATQLATALDRIQTPPRLIVPLLNGLEHVNYLRERIPQSLTCSASIRIDAEKKAAAEISHTSSFAVIDAAFDDDWWNHRELRPLKNQLGISGIALMVSSSEVQVLWSKIVFLNALSLTSAITGMPVGWIRKQPEWRRKLQLALEEGAAVAQAEGAKVSVDMTMDYVDHARYQLSSVMQRDIKAGVTPELDAISGAVLRVGTGHGLLCPTIRELTAEVAARTGIPVPVA